MVNRNKYFLNGQKAVMVKIYLGIIFRCFLIKAETANFKAKLSSDMNFSTTLVYFLCLVVGFVSAFCRENFKEGNDGQCYFLAAEGTHVSKYSISLH